MTESPKKVRKLKLSSMKVDSQKEREGDWMPALDIDDSGDIKWFVRSTNYAEFKTARDVIQIKLTNKHGRNVPEDVLAEAYGKLAVEYLLLGWIGLVDDNEQDIDFSEETAREILTDPEYRLVRGSIYLAASRVGLQETEFVGAGAKN
ncbi:MULTISPECIES: hypothetical protein [unclassified Bradyrhizobium]|uniref:hypothetical protein n=1 Tax=Bradyrhizobium sp. USDA 4541 TaxID=2817704 RepID=UPI0020A2AAA6|nr:hypothetical protein [Bradyrhizobium sp. USDA 4541]MCP1852794.1 hypothetical protein [Bradyrhizobium sp. USDA 4541]